MIKRQFGHVKVRYRGLAKNTAQPHTLFALANLWIPRKRLAGPGVRVRPKLPRLAAGAMEPYGKHLFVPALLHAVQIAGDGHVHRRVVHRVPSVRLRARRAERYPPRRRLSTR